jgi:hypothetical protein
VVSASRKAISAGGKGIAAGLKTIVPFREVNRAGLERFLGGA